MSYNKAWHMDPHVSRLVSVWSTVSGQLVAFSSTPTVPFVLLSIFLSLKLLLDWLIYCFFSYN